MNWIIAVGDSFLATLPWLAGLGVGFAVLVRLMPCNKGMFWGSDPRAAVTDLLYWFIGPLFVRVAKTFLLAAGVAMLFGGRDAGFAALAGLPIWGQCVLILLIQDVCLYGIHRFFHTPRAWSFHAVHHSPRLLDWASASRNHFVNHLFSSILVDVFVLLLGFQAEALIALVPFSMIYSSMVHANLNWTFGPFRYVFASPVFHRWHHVSEGEAIDKNFASTFPILDLIFGTFYMPVGQLPEHFGNGDVDYPEDFWGQFVSPFVKRERVAEPMPQNIPGSMS